MLLVGKVSWQPDLPAVLDASVDLAIRQPDAHRGDLRGGHRHTGGLKELCFDLDDERLAVDQDAIAVEDQQTLSERTQWLTLPLREPVSRQPGAAAGRVEDCIHGQLIST
jgi:hypothetical protein